jgi:hypothetical protein
LVVDGRHLHHAGLGLDDGWRDLQGGDALLGLVDVWPRLLVGVGRTEAGVCNELLGVLR